MNKKKKDQEKQTFFIRFGLTQKQKEKVQEIANQLEKSLSDFIRDAIFDKIRMIEHPEQFMQNPTYLNSDILEQLTLNTKKIIELQEETNKRLEIAQDIEKTRFIIKEEYNKLRKRGLITDYSKDAETIANLLSVHKSLTPEQISKKTDLDIETIILILQINDLFKLNIITGRYELK